MYNEDLKAHIYLIPQTWKLNLDLPFKCHCGVYYKSGNSLSISEDRDYFVRKDWRVYMKEN